jgi:apolipoprotein D and lipocalin family protein
MFYYAKLSLAILSVFIITGCGVKNPIRTAQDVDIDRYMGEWYVISHIPTFIETESYNAVEIYEKKSERKIATTFRFNKGALDGPVKEYNPMGFLTGDADNAIWKMQFLWPFKADYRIVYLNDDYTTVVVGRNKRDYVWVMARTTSIPDDEYTNILTMLKEEGYDLSNLREVPHDSI